MHPVHLARRGILIFLLALVGTTFALIWLSRLIPRPAHPTIAFAWAMTVFLSYSPGSRR
jgi:hypothetical protein